MFHRPLPFDGAAARKMANESSGQTDPPPTPPRGEQAFVRVRLVPLLGGVRGGFMVSMRASRFFLLKSVVKKYVRRFFILFLLRLRMYN